MEAIAKIIWQLHPNTDEWQVRAEILDGPHIGTRFGVYKSAMSRRFVAGDHVRVTFEPDDQFCTIDGPAYGREDEDPTRPCSVCGKPLDTRGELNRNMCVDCSDDAETIGDWLLAVVDEGGDGTWKGTAIDYLAANPDDREQVTRLLVGSSFSGGGGAAPWYAVVRLPNRIGGES